MARDDLHAQSGLSRNQKEKTQQLPSTNINLLSSKYQSREHNSATKSLHTRHNYHLEEVKDSLGLTLNW